MNDIKAKKGILALTDQLLSAEKDLIDVKTILNNVLVPIMQETTSVPEPMPSHLAESQDSDTLKKLEDHLCFLSLYVQDIAEITRNLQL